MILRLRLTTAGKGTRRQSSCLLIRILRLSSGRQGVKAVDFAIYLEHIATT